MLYCSIIIFSPICVATLDLQTVGELTSIWTSKKWEFVSPEESSQAFDWLCSMFEQIPKDLHWVALNLIRSYSLYSFNRYQSLLISALSMIQIVGYENIERVVFSPLLNPSDDRRLNAKSGHTLPYLARYTPLPNGSFIKTLKTDAVASPSAIPEYLKSGPTLVVLLDDFIGSGDTAKNAVFKCQELIRAEDKILVVGLVVMTKAVSTLEGYGIKLIYGALELKGIEENELFPDKKPAYAMIDIVESAFDIHKDERWGYNKSEALVTMLRTPDNTFPMFWCTKNLDGTSWPAPFPRTTK
jgi:hypothetical protein